jgi:hypothetical protein
MKAFYEGVNKNNNANWVAKLIDNYRFSQMVHTHFVLTIKEI